MAAWTRHHRPGRCVPRLAAVKAGSVALLVPLLMRLPLPTIAGVLRYADRGWRERGGRRLGADPERLVAALARAQRACGPFLLGGCQTRAVTLYWFLRRAGYAVELCFGIEPLPHHPSGHCWLELGGQPFLEQHDPRPRFAEMFRVP